MQQLKVITQKPLLIVAFVILAIAVGYWLGQKRVIKKGLRPAEIIKNLPAKKRQAQKSKAKTPFVNLQVQQLKEDSAAVLDENSETETQENIQNMNEVSVSFQLSQKMQNVAEATREDVQNNILLADNLIVENPDDYSAYKSKLINLLLLETKYQQTVPIEEYEALYTELLSFEGINPSDEVLQEAEGLGGTESTLSATELTNIDYELLHIPFLRLSAMSEYQELAEISDEYIEAFPDSYLGYLYLAESLWRQGDEPSAISVLQEYLDTDTADPMVVYLFSTFQANPLQRIYNLRIY